MGGVLHARDQPGGERLVGHALDELAAEVLGPGDLRDRALALAQQLLEDRAHPGGQAARLAVPFDDPGDATVDGAELEVDLGEAVGQLLGRQGSAHTAHHDTVVVNVEGE